MAIITVGSTEELCEINIYYRSCIVLQWNEGHVGDNIAKFTCFVLSS